MGIETKTVRIITCDYCGNHMPEMRLLQFYRGDLRHNQYAQGLVLPKLQQIHSSDGARKIA
jgi:hypothetical protein